MSLREWTVGRVAAAWALWLVLTLAAAVGAAVVYALWWAPPPGVVRMYGVSAGTVRTLVAALLAPPALLTAAWAWQRRTDR